MDIGDEWLYQVEFTFGVMEYDTLQPVPQRDIVDDFVHLARFVHAPLTSTQVAELRTFPVEHQLLVMSHFFFVPERIRRHLRTLVFPVLAAAAT